MNNPFTLSFGKKPVQYISRIAQTERIIGDFTAEEIGRASCRERV